eukprot:1150935-Pelagomonas_calceolata.AAC.19
MLHGGRQSACITSTLSSEHLDACGGIRSAEIVIAEQCLLLPACRCAPETACLLVRASETAGPQHAHT